MDIQAGELFNGRYRLLSEKGRGAFGDVWLAHDEQIDLDVAIKIYIVLDNRGIDDFKSEYKNAYTLNHPNLLHAYHFDVVDNRPFLVMPYCPGSAESLIGCTDESIIWRFIRDVASGLEYLHCKNILHRDIKPDNILLDADGNFLITDFGVSTKMKSTLRRNSTRMMSSGDVTGTIGYMAPELFTKTPNAVKATDIWAFGATLYEILNGELPFFGQGGIMLEHGAEIPALNGKWSEALRQTVEACLAKDTWARPTASQLSAYASKCAQGMTEKAPWQKPDGPEQSVHDKKSDNNNKNAYGNKEKKWKRWLWGAIAAIIVIVAVPTVMNHNDSNIEETNPSDNEIISDTIEEKILIDGKYDSKLFYDSAGGVSHLRLYKTFSEECEFYNKPSWLKIYPGSNNLTVICELNKTHSTRSVTVYFRRKGDDSSWDNHLASLTVTQEGESKIEKESRKENLKQVELPKEEAKTISKDTDKGETQGLQHNRQAKPQLNASSITLKVGEMVKLTVNNYIGDITWKSSNDSFCTVSSNGQVIGKRQGIANIMAFCGIECLMCSVLVQNNPETSKTLIESKSDKIDYGISYVDLKVGEFVTLRVNGYSGNIVWSSECPEVAYVDINGLVKGLSEGKTKIWAKCGEFYKCFQISVKANEQNKYKYISGRITDFSTGKPLVGAAITIKGTVNGTMSDANGYYSLTANQGDILRVSCKKYKTESMSIGYGSVINFRLKKK